MVLWLSNDQWEEQGQKTTEWVREWGGGGLSCCSHAMTGREKQNGGWRTVGEAKNGRGQKIKCRVKSRTQMEKRRLMTLLRPVIHSFNERIEPWQQTGNGSG